MKRENREAPELKLHVSSARKFRIGIAPDAAIGAVPTEPHQTKHSPSFEMLVISMALAKLREYAHA